MRSWTFSLTSLLGIITLLALNLGAVVADSEMAASASYTLFLGLLCFAIAASFTAPADRKPFWAGFAVFALVYALTVFEPSPSPGARNFSSPFVMYSPNPNQSSSHFITTNFLDVVEGMLVPRHDVGSHVYSRWLSGGYYWGTILEVDEGKGYLIKWDDGSTPTWQTRADVAGTSTNRRVALHSTVATVWALLGGAIVAYWSARKQTPKTPSPVS